ncbi:MAG: sel1 repeat family protein [Verrucomicrobia bacterium]|nr:sel1 repeat family protein [Verrucomicrobiota bacterium]
MPCSHINVRCWATIQAYNPPSASNPNPLMKNILFAALVCVPSLFFTNALAQQAGPLNQLFLHYKAKAEQGDAHAQNNVGSFYRVGQAVAKDEKEAVKWYRKAAEQNYAPAQFSLGFCYENGIGVEKDNAEAMKWYRKADLAGAHRQLGNYYFKGEGVEKDYTEAVKWFRKYLGAKIVLAANFRRQSAHRRIARANRGQAQERRQVILLRASMVF